ncbi:MAG: FlxA-like family protein [Clostridium sp.]|nr:FlxA-like family protein [Clostridium sp.]
MTINGINGANAQMGQMGMNQATDSYSRNIQSQIANAQKQLQELSSNEDMSLEEKMKKRQEIQQQISDLNMQLRQHQADQRKEKQQAKGSSMDDMLGGTRKAGNTKEGKSTGISQASMTALISADSSMKQAEVQGNVASRFEGRAGVLEIEIKLDESRAVNGLSANTEGKKAELAEVEQKAMDVTASQMETLGDVNKSIEEANKADEQSDDKDTKTSSSKEKDEENVSGADSQEKDVSNAENGNAPSGVSVPANTSPDETTVTPQPKAYTSVDIRV